MYFVYVLQGKIENEISFYIGYTADLKQRLKKHRSKSVKSTKNFESVELIYYEACLNDSDARKREIQLKTGFGRGYIKRRLKHYLSK